ncbi:MAG: N-acetylneuraminate synthase family protein, partial [Bacilli bacterium]
MNIIIGNKQISELSPVYIIAEIGVNHNGSIDQAKRLIDAAILTGADAVKFQMFRTESLVSEEAPLASYQKTSGINNQKEMLERLELSRDEFVILKKYCDDANITFLSTPFDESSAYELNELNVPAFKIGSGDLTNFPLLTQVNRFNKPIILSTGMSTIQEIKAALRVIDTNPHVVLMHCTSAYPAHFQDLHLNVIRTFKLMFNTIIGYSDHSLGIEVPIATVAMGYKVIEKHFTLDKFAEGPDHKTSLTPDEFNQMVKSIRYVEKALGSTYK